MKPSAATPESKCLHSIDEMCANCDGVTDTREWCWPLRHDWAKWVDDSAYQKESVITNSVFEIGIVQERRCKRCGMAQRRQVPG